ncbi:AAA family protein [Botryosphaeria dothidea]|uniref:AAA family protein n=1 Tax=Botryosphaeria dothidea TaxID=55169 RepID=A0A8H4N8Y7_9PEZI|nr:AAA family protein [Botryosphaeria dothidea]
MYISLCTHSYQARLYAGTKYVLDSESRLIRERPLCGKIIIDTFAYFTVQSDERPKNPKLNSSKVNPFFSGDRKPFQVEIDLSNEQQHRKGDIILLSGPPGVGKTLTAESVAERSRVPVYFLRASDLGTDPSEVESTLWNVLGCCKLWNAVLLIDEADVFLEARSADRMEQNEPISIFLRNLEYYQGIMFLTTNRVESIDTAFRSRIDLILPYPDLNLPARRKIWSSFLEPLAKKRSFSEREYDELAEADLNGREVKNAVKISRFVAASEQHDLQMEH